MNQFSLGGARLPAVETSNPVSSSLAAARHTNSRLLAIVSYIALLTMFLPVAASAQEGDPASKYQVLEWKDLVAEGWKRPLLLTEEEVSSPRIDESSLVPELDQKLVAIPGFMRPAVKLGQQVLAHDHDHEELAEGTYVSEFLLVPFLPSNPCSHALWDPNQVVYVNLLEPVLVDDPESPVWVVGTITLDNIMTDDGLSAYRIVEAVTTNYEY